MIGTFGGDLPLLLLLVLSPLSSFACIRSVIARRSAISTCLVGTNRLGNFTSIFAEVTMALRPLI